MVASVIDALGLEYISVMRPQRSPSGQRAMLRAM